MSKTIISQVFQQSLIHQNLSTAISKSKEKIHLKGVLGSSLSFTIASVFKTTNQPFLLIFDNKEEAAYYLNDLEVLLDDKEVLFYPGSYRRPYQIEETDNANVVSRAEVLERINNGKNVWIVTYPQALFEHVPTQKKLAQNTLRIEVGKTYSIDFINELLLEYHFDRVDFVYEPG